MKLISTTALLCVLLLCSAQASAGSPINQTHPLKADARVSVKNMKGRIEVRAWDKNEVELKGTLGEGNRRLDVNVDEDGNLDIEVVPPLRMRDHEPSELLLRVPERASLELESLSADLVVNGGKGFVQADSVSGDVLLSGDFTRVQAETVSGDVLLSCPCVNAELDTVSGDIRAKDVSGETRVESVSGDLSVSGGPWRELRAESVSGDVEVRIEKMGRNDDLLVDAVSGDVRVLLPGDAALGITAATLSGDIETFVGQVDEPEYGPGESLEAQIGKGGARLGVETQSGDITLRKK